MSTTTSPATDSHNMKMSLLVIDDDPVVCELVERVAKNEGVAFQSLQSAKNLNLQMFTGHQLVLLDLMMPETDGVQVMDILKAAENPPKLILISGVGEQALAAAERLAQTKGLQVEILAKPFRANKLADVLRKHFPIDLPPFRAKDKPTPRFAISSDELLQALQTDLIHVSFQPICAIESGECSGVEAISRWNHPTHGLLEYKHFAHFLDEPQAALLYLNTVLVQTISGYHTLGRLSGYHGTMSIKMPARLFTDSAMVDQLFSVVKEARFDTSRLAIEMQEPSLTAGLDTGLDNQTRLRLRNIELHVDNFGSGNAGLRNLKNSAFNTLKINISQTHQIIDSEASPKTLASTVNLASYLGITVVATGADDEQAHNMAHSIGFNKIQGNYQCGPMSAGQLADWLNRPNDQRIGQKNSSGLSLSGRLLLVEDNPILQQMYGTFLLKRGFSVDYADDGLAGLTHLKNGGYCLVIMDGMMPKMDGIEATQRIRALPGELCQVPVLALTALSSDKDRERFMSAGVNAMLTKPVRLGDLLSEVERLIKQTQTKTFEN